MTTYILIGIDSYKFLKHWGGVLANTNKIPALNSLRLDDGVLELWNNISTSSHKY